MSSTTDGMTEEQQNYLQGFVSGADLARSGRGLPTFANTFYRNGATVAPTLPAQAQVAAGSKGAAQGLPIGPEAVHYRAQDRIVAEGKKLCPEGGGEAAEIPARPLGRALCPGGQGAVPQRPGRPGDQVISASSYVAPAQDSFMCRLRFPAGIMSTHQFRGTADVAEQYGGGYTHATTRANLQIREIKAGDAIRVLSDLQSLGIVPQGSGADNIRNITASPTAGIDPLELIDTRPLAKDLHYYILHHRDMAGLPRKFNIAFDGGGAVAVLEETNDIGFSAVRVAEGKAVPSGVYFRLALGGITGHKDFARDTGILLRTEECIPGRGGRRPRLQRARRPDRPAQGADEVRPRPLGPGEIRRRDREALAVAVRPVPARPVRSPTAARPRRPHRLPPANGSRAWPTSASCSRSGRCRATRCADWPRSPTDTAAARSG